MWQYVLKRLLLVIPTLLGIVVITFGVVQLVPGGPVEQKIAELKNRQRGESSSSVSSGAQKNNQLSPEQIQKLKELYGFDKPIPVQFALLTKKLFTFDFGDSYFRQDKVLNIIISKLPVSMSLGITSFLLIYLVCIPLGISKAVRRGTKFDAISSSVVLFAYAIPGLVMAITLVVLFGGGSFFSVFPIRGLTSDNFDELPLMQKVFDYLWHLVLPVIAYMINAFAVLTMQTRNLFLEELNQQYVTTARAKGVREKLVLWKHVFRNAMIFIISGVPGSFLFMFFAGSLFIETVFSLDGIGLLMFESTLRRDYPIVLAEMFLMSMLGLLAKIMADVTLVFVDPRISFDKAPGA